MRPITRKTTVMLSRPNLNRRNSKVVISAANHMANHIQFFCFIFGFPLADDISRSCNRQGKL
jgi:hypothetical protein